MNTRSFKRRLNRNFMTRQLVSFFCKEGGKSALKWSGVVVMFIPMIIVLMTQGVIQRNSGIVFLSSFPLVLCLFLMAVGRSIHSGGVLYRAQMKRTNAKFARHRAKVDAEFEAEEVRFQESQKKLDAERKQFLEEMKDSRLTFQEQPEEARRRGFI